MWMVHCLKLVIHVPFVICLVFLFWCHALFMSYNEIEQKHWLVDWCICVPKAYRLGTMPVWQQWMKRKVSNVNSWQKRNQWNGMVKTRILERRDIYLIHTFQWKLSISQTKTPWSNKQTKFFFFFSVVVVFLTCYESIYIYSFSHVSFAFWNRKRQTKNVRKQDVFETFSFHFLKCQCLCSVNIDGGLFPIEKPKWKQENRDLDGNQFTLEHLFQFVLVSYFNMVSAKKRKNRYERASMC